MIVLLLTINPFQINLSRVSIPREFNGSIYVSTLTLTLTLTLTILNLNRS